MFLGCVCVCVSNLTSPWILVWFEGEKNFTRQSGRYLEMPATSQCFEWTFWFCLGVTHKEIPKELLGQTN